MRRRWAARAAARKRTHVFSPPPSMETLGAIPQRRPRATCDAVAHAKSVASRQRAATAPCATSRTALFRWAPAATPSAAAGKRWETTTSRILKLGLRIGCACQGKNVRPLPRTRRERARRARENHAPDQPEPARCGGTRRATRRCAASARLPLTSASRRARGRTPRRAGDHRAPPTAAGGRLPPFRLFVALLEKGATEHGRRIPKKSRESATLGMDPGNCTRNLSKSSVVLFGLDAVPFRL
jgi:hypothetical protein